MGDLLAATYPDRVYMLHLPRSSGDGVVGRLAADLERLDGWLHSRHTDAAPTQDTAEQAEPPTLDYRSPPRSGGVFVVSGPLSDDSLLSLIDKLGAHVSGLESCTSPDRWKALAADALDFIPNGGAATEGLIPALAPADYQALAGQVLATGICPRRSTQDRRAYLERRLDEARPASVIYARQSFCDPGAYDALLVNSLARERGLPYLEIEVDFPFDANGPLRVRVEAFLEAQLMDDDLLNDDDLFLEN